MYQFLTLKNVSQISYKILIGKMRIIKRITSLGIMKILQKDEHRKDTIKNKNSRTF